MTACHPHSRSTSHVAPSPSLALICKEHTANSTRLNAVAMMPDKGSFQGPLQNSTRLNVVAMMPDKGSFQRTIANSTRLNVVAMMPDKGSSQGPL
ncbi:hypothetical protein SESBI_29855 [Sesbania bispinosa]|nr:hypothetical protein SESBI_29855 [Sesbania bispinosa]